MKPSHVDNFEERNGKVLYWRAFSDSAGGGGGGGGLGLTGAERLLKEDKKIKKKTCE